MKTKLTIDILQQEAALYAKTESQHFEPTLYAVTDGKAVGTYVEHKFLRYLQERYDFTEGNSAKGIDLRELEYSRSLCLSLTVVGARF